MIIVNQECTKCGVCVDICPVGLITMEQDGPKLNYAASCIKCGHCVAVCPQGSLDHEMVPINNQVPLDDYHGLDPRAAEQFMRSRRSIRKYKKDAVPKEEMLKLLDIARFAPSGGNSQGLSYIVVTEKELLTKISEVTLKWMENQINKGGALSKAYKGIVQNTEQDMILRDAPVLVIATAPKNFPIGRDNARFSLAYLELYAPTFGLGSCWAGFFEMCAASGYSEIYKLLNISEETMVVGAVMVGYPKYKYHRLVDRNPLQVTWR